MLTEYKPTVAVRATRSIFRIRDVADSMKNAEATHPLTMARESAKNLTIESKELSDPKKGEQGTVFEVETKEGFEKWCSFICYSLGKNMGILQREGYVHGYLHMGNVTLAGEIVDLDSVSKAVIEGEYHGAAAQKEAWFEKLKNEKINGKSKGPFFSKTKKGWADINPTMVDRVLPVPPYNLPNALMKDIRDISYTIREFTRMFSVFPQGRSLNYKKMADEVMRGYTEGMSKETKFALIGITNERLTDIVKTLVVSQVQNGNSYPIIKPDGA